MAIFHHISGTADRLRRCQHSSPVSDINFWWSSDNCWSHPLLTCRDLYSAARQSRRNVLITTWCDTECLACAEPRRHAGLSAAAGTLVFTCQHESILTLRWEVFCYSMCSYCCCIWSADMACPSHGMSLSPASPYLTISLCSFSVFFFRSSFTSVTVYHDVSTPCGPEQSPLYPYPFTSPPSALSFSIFYSSLFSFLTRFSYFSLFHSTRIVPLQAVCHRRRVNLDLVCLDFMLHVFFN